MATTHKVYETTSTYKGKPLKMRHTLTDVDEDYTPEEALARIERSVLPEGASGNSIREITAEDPTGPLAKVTTNAGSSVNKPSAPSVPQQ